MKRIMQAAVLAALLAGAQVAVSGTFPAGGDDGVFLMPESTYADSHGGGSAIAKDDSYPASDEGVVFHAPASTYAGSHGGSSAITKDDSYPASDEGVVFHAPESTYAERKANERNVQQARGASDPALSE